MRVYKSIIFLSTVIIVESNNFITCPKILSYKKQPMTNEIFVQITIPNPPKNFTRLTLSVIYQTRDAFIDEDRGHIRLQLTTEKTMEKIRQGDPIIYFVHFPVLFSPPSILLITLNKIRYCVGRRDPFAQSVTLNHHLYPPVFCPGNLICSLIIPSSTISTTFPTSTSFKPTVVPPKKGFIIDDSHSLQNFLKKELNELSAGCGYPMDDSQAKFQDNVRLRPGQWPWMAAIYITTSTFQFLCSGALISKRHVVTAAHCIFYENRELTPNLLFVSLGRYRFNDWNESSNFEVSKITIHPDFKFIKTSDLAILKLSKIEKLNPQINHLCILQVDKIYFESFQEIGYIAGWGDKSPAKSEPDTSEKIIEENSVPKLHLVPTISPEKCLEKSPKLTNFITEKTFCAGSQNGVSGPCNGDDGAAVAVRGADGKFYLRGIALLPKNGTSECDYKDFVVFVDTIQYRYWILSNILEN